jgi:hypothetical protein
VVGAALAEGSTMSMSPQDVVEQKHAMAGLAEIFRAYFLDLQKQGFSKREAMQIVLDYQRELIRGSTHA